MKQNIETIWKGELIQFQFVMRTLDWINLDIISIRYGPFFLDNVVGWFVSSERNDALEYIRRGRSLSAD